MSEAAIKAKLDATAAVTALIGDPCRLRGGILRQNETLPAVCLNLISKVREHAFSADPGVTRARWQLTAWAAKSGGWDSCKAIVDAMRNALKRASGTIGGVTVDNIDIENESDEYDPERDLFGRRMDVLVIYREA